MKWPSVNKTTWLIIAGLSSLTIALILTLSSVVGRPTHLTAGLLPNIEAPVEPPTPRSPRPHRATLENLQLHLSTPAMPGIYATLENPPSYSVILEGPMKEVNKVLSTPEQVFVFVRLSLEPESLPHTVILPVRCILMDEAIRKVVSVHLAPDEPTVACVRITREK